MHTVNLVFFIIFIAWGLPLTYFRSRFRKMVYQTDSWFINFKPVFWKEMKAITGYTRALDARSRKLRNFYRFYLLVYLLLFVTYLFFNQYEQNKISNTMKKIEIGDHVPLFALSDQHGKVFNIADVIGKNKLVIYFYPKDDSPGCTKEACYFRDQFEVFSEADALIIGISGQSVESHRKFAEKYRLSFILLSDEGNRVRAKFGVPTNLFGMLPGRVTYVADKAGKIIYIFNSQTEATKHVDEALKALKTNE